MITLSTILYENNFLNFFNENNWFWNFKNKHITEKLIIVNNLTSKDLFNKVSSNWSYQYNFKVFFVEEFENFAKEKFNLNFDKNNLGYVYTIPYYVMFSQTNTNYILNVATDCMNDILIEEDYLINSINELDNNHHCLITSLPWSKNNQTNNGLTCGEYETMSYRLTDYKTDDFCPSYSFSDQVFLTSIKNMNQVNFNSPDSGRYLGPHYCGGICFEKKIVDYLSFSNKFRFIYNKNSYYVHNS